MKRGARIREEVEFLRIFFPVPEEADIAIRIAGLIAPFLGERLAELRPNSLVSEIFPDWEATDSLAMVELIMGLEEILGTKFPDDFAELTFRELVEFASH